MRHRVTKLLGSSVPPALAAFLAVLCVLCLTAPLPAQTQPAPPPTTSTAANAQTPAQSGTSAATQTKPAATKPKHVITNEELEPHTIPGAAPKGEKNRAADSAALLACDSTCEQDARDQLGYGVDYEAEWRAQIVEARRDLSADAEWRGMLGQALQQTNSYCKFQLQQSRQLSSNRSDFRSQMQRAKNAQYFENMDRALRQQLDSTANRMQNHTEEVQLISHVRAALMAVQANRIVSRPCTDTEPR